jgi:hypothetical protein
MRDLIEIFAILFISLLLVLACIFPFAYMLDKTQCTGRLSAQELTGNYDFWAGCMVITEGGNKVPLNYYNMREAIKRGTN